MEVLADLPRPGHYLLRNPLARPDGFFLTRVGARASCHALIPITVELMLPVTYTRNCHVYGHRQPIILASVYSPTYPSSGFRCLALRNQYLHQRRYPVPSVYSPRTYRTNSRGSAFDVRGEPFGSPLKSHRDFRRFPIEFPYTGARPRGGTNDKGRTPSVRNESKAEAPGTYLRTYLLPYLLGTS